MTNVTVQMTNGPAPKVTVTGIVLAGADAAHVIVTPHGGITETNAQAALQGLDTRTTATESEIVDLGTLLATKAVLVKVATTVSVDGALVLNKHNPVDCTDAAHSTSLPTGAAQGSEISVEKVDATTHVLSVTGNIRGVASSSITLTLSHESVVFRADGTGSWWPYAGHKTKASLDSLYVDRTLYDAKGDLLVGSANDTAVKFPAGSNGALLVPDSSQASGLRWTSTRYIEGNGSPEGSVAATAGSTYKDMTSGILWTKRVGAGTSGWITEHAAPVFTPASGEWFIPEGQAATSTTASSGNNAARAYPVLLRQTLTIDRLAANVTAAGTAGTTIRQAVYADTGNAYPGALLYDSGTLPADAIGSPGSTTAMSLTLPPGLYWFVTVTQNVTTTQPTIVTYIPASPVPFRTAGAANGAVTGYFATVTGAFPPTWTTSVATVGSANRLQVRAA